MKYIKQSLLFFTMATASGAFLYEEGKLNVLVKKDDIKKVEQFLNDNKNIDINGDEYFPTPLFQACLNNNIEIIKILLSHGADVNKSNCDKNIPLMEAIEHGSIKIVKLLLSYGADINQSDRDNNTPLMKSCELGHKEILKLLLSHGADVNKSYFKNFTLLQTACILALKSQQSLGHKEIVKLLLSHGADVNKPGYKNQTPFEIIKIWSIEKQNQLFKDFFIIKQVIKETEIDKNTRLFIEFNAADHADSFNQNKTLVPFIITDKQRKDLLCAGGFKDVKNKEFIISIGEDLLNNLFFRFEKNNNTLPVFIFEQPKTIHPYVKQLKIQRDFQVFKNRNIKSYDDLIYKIKLLAFAQKSWKKWNKKQKSKVQFEDVTVNFKNDNSDS